MNELHNFWHWHPAMCGMIGMWLFTTVVTMMPTPSANDSPWYIWFFRSLHAIAAGVPRLVATLSPNSAMGKLLVNGNAPTDAPKNP